jgi:hypothetical protein
MKKYAIALLFVGRLFAQTTIEAAHYSFDSNALDISGNANHGTIQNAVYVADRFGNAAKALFFDGDDSVMVTNAPSLNPQTVLSISAWYKTTTFAGKGYSSIADKGFTSHSSPTYQFKLGVTGNLYSNLPGRFGFSICINNNLYSLFTSTNFWQPERWYHLAGTYNGSVICLYINGVLTTSVNASGSLSTFATPLFMGSNTTKSDLLYGTVDDVIIYYSGLTASQVHDIYEGVKTGVPLRQSLELNVWPNPAREKIYFQLPEGEEFCHFEIIDEVGNIVLNGSELPGDMTLNISALPKGMYLLKLFSKENVISRKVLVE